MKYKILIIDDDKYHQMKLNYHTDINRLIQEKYADFIQYIQNLSSKDLKSIPEADIIMIHDSYPDIEMKDKIIQIARENQVHIIRFSNGLTATFRENGHGVENIELKKDRVYTNLSYFMEDLKRQGKPDFSKLIFGENYALVKSILIRENLSKTLLIRYGQKAEYLIPEYSQEEKDLRELFYLAYGEKHFDYFNELIENPDTGYEAVLDACDKMVSIINSKI